ncbi:hypothetical protein MJL30_35595, partial [Salmonella enterica subsp. enterica serovar Anatum]|nr:hypothetical protein [Salmonella enterica subsp. enterica serovar Anatum]
INRLVDRHNTGDTDNTAHTSFSSLSHISEPVTSWARNSTSFAGGYIRLGIEEGATLLAGGAEKPTDLPAHLKGGNFLRPTVLADVD